MQHKFLVTAFRVMATLLLLLSFLSVIAIVISDKGDFIDRNSGWISLIFLMAIGIFIGSIAISDASPPYTRKKKTTDELMNEIKKPNLDKLRKGNNSDKISVS